VREQIRRQTGHHARFTHFAIVGLCAECAARPAVAVNPLPVHDSHHSHGSHSHHH
jgi:hypothetical protein